MTHAKKACIHILIMRLKPIPKRRSQHARLRPRGPALHYIVAAVEKVSGVSGIERERLEAGERVEEAGGPFPSIRQQALDAESASPAWERVHGARVVTLQAKVSTPRIGEFGAPWIALAFG